jgi:hypothetical protein
LCGTQQHLLCVLYIYVHYHFVSGFLFIFIFCNKTFKYLYHFTIFRLLTWFLCCSAKGLDNGFRFKEIKNIRKCVFLKQLSICHIMKAWNGKHVMWYDNDLMEFVSTREIVKIKVTAFFFDRNQKIFCFLWSMLT